MCLFNQHTIGEIVQESVNSKDNSFQSFRVDCSLEARKLVLSMMFPAPFLYLDDFEQELCRVFFRHFDRISTGTRVNQGPCNNPVDVWIFNPKS